MQGTGDQHGGTGIAITPASQPGPAEAANDEQQADRQADAGADHRQHRQDIGELPARQADGEEAR